MLKEGNKKKYLIKNNFGLLLIIFFIIINLSELSAIENKNIKDNVDESYLLDENLFNLEIIKKSNQKKSKESNTEDKTNNEFITGRTEILKPTLKTQSDSYYSSDIKSVQNNFSYSRANYLKEKVDKISNSIKIENFLLYETDDTNIFKIFPPLAEANSLNIQKIKKPYKKIDFIENYDFDFKSTNVKYKHKRTAYLKKLFQNKILQFAGIIILVASIIISISILIYNYRKLLFFNLKKFDMTDKLKAENFYKELLKNPDKTRKKSKAEIIEELRKISRK